MLIKWSRGNYPEHVARNFSLGAFECPCQKCGPQQIAADMLERLDALHDKLKGGILIVRGFVCKDSAPKGETKSRHFTGRVVEISSNTVSMAELEKLCERLFDFVTVRGETAVVRI
jgi:hypothetical protein